MRKRTKNGRGRFGRAVKLEIHEHKSSFFVYTALQVATILSMARQFYLGNYEGGFLCLLTVLLLMLPSIIQVQFRIELPTTLEIIVLLFVFSAEILGEINSFYILIPYWDMILHTLSGFLAAAIGFSLTVLLNESERLEFNLSPLFTAIVAFSFSMTIGVLWEFFEYVMDTYFHFDMQKDTVIHAISTVMLDPTASNTVIRITGITDTVVNGKSLGLGGYLDIGLIDTMEDLFVNFIGAFVFSVIGYFYVKNKGKGGIVGRFVPTMKEEEKDYMKHQ
jgi:hypothetical protein